MRYYLNEFTDYFGHAKTIFLSGALIVLFIALWLVLFNANIALDYQISALKKEIQEKEDKISVLQEEVATSISDQKILEWAQANDFTKVTNISYLNLSAGNLAQADHLNLK
jgi:cell division protein FtsL